MNVKTARAQGYRDGFLCFQANQKISQPEFINHGLLVGRMYSDNKNTLAQYAEGWNSAFGNKMRELQRNIKLATQDIEYMESRAAGWHKEHDAPALEEVTSQPAPVLEEETGAAAALEDSPIEVGDIVRPSVLYCPFATWTRAKVIGLNFYDNVDGKWVIDIQFMNGLELSQTKQYLMALWEVELVERSAQTSDLDRELEAIETRKRKKIAALKAKDFTGYEEALDKQLNVGCTDTQKVWIQAARALVVEIMDCPDCIKEICKIHSAKSDSFPPYPD